MTSMDAALLVLVLAQEPATKEASVAVAMALADRAGQHVRILQAAEAEQELARFGLHAPDLVAQPQLAKGLTGQLPTLALVRLENRRRGGDDVIEARYWFAGRQESHVAIGAPGATGAAVSGAVRAATTILGPWLQEASGRPGSGNDLASLVRRGDWPGLLTASSGDGARERYHRILALVRLERLAEARIEADGMAAAHPGHFLTSQGMALVAPTLLPGNEPLPADASAALLNQGDQDDGSNILR